MADVLERYLKEELERWDDDELREKTLIKFTHFNENGYESELYDSVNDIEIDPKDDINWIYITGLDDEDKIMQLEDKFDIHPLVIEDMLSSDERTKVEQYEDFLFVVTDTVSYRKQSKISDLDFSQISFIIKDNLIITVDEKRSHQFNRLQQRLKYIPKTRFKSIDAMFFTLINQVVDNYYMIFDIIGDDIDNLEEEIMDDPHESLLEDLYTIKKNLIYLRKTLWPLRNVVSEISKMRFYELDNKTEIYYRDVYDHIIQMLEFIDVYRDMTASLIDAVDTNIGNKTNDVMKILTVWSTIFLPLTFITGVYGMNFNYMPELYQKWAYPIFWVVTILIVGFMIAFFKKKDWI
ncbi:MAG: magnesium/cobalt transporter CorA [Tissierellia bacterium]|nr:magnesium/cobalt transporter CorA [Tissierellia bacterium]